jgi:hypothetical protein
MDAVPIVTPKAGESLDSYAQARSVYAPELRFDAYGMVVSSVSKPHQQNHNLDDVALVPDVIRDVFGRHILDHTHSIDAYWWRAQASGFVIMLNHPCMTVFLNRQLCIWSDLLVHDFFFVQVFVSRARHGLSRRFHSGVRRSGSLSEGTQGSHSIQVANRHAPSTIAAKLRFDLHSSRC